jgi:hypothetical protein
MSNKIFQDYQNSGLYFSLEEVRERIEDLTSQLRGCESYYRRHQPEVLTKEQREDILLENEIQDEIDFWEQQIHNSSDVKGCEEYVNKIAASHFNNDEEDEEDGDEDGEPYYHINDYCDPYLGRASPLIPEFDSDEEEPESKINSLEKKLDGVENVVYQLLGGLFNQETQSNMIDLHQCCLRGSEYQGEIDKDTSIWPTTRQGDQHEEEIRLLKQQVSKLEGTVEMLVRLLAEKLKN